MTIENDTLLRKRIHDYWDERLKREAAEAREMSRLRVVEDFDTRPWFIRLIDWLVK